MTWPLDPVTRRPLMDPPRYEDPWLRTLALALKGSVVRPPPACPPTLERAPPLVTLLWAWCTCVMPLRVGPV